MDQLPALRGELAGSEAEVSRQDLQTGARAVRVVMDKRNAMELTGAKAMDIGPGEAGRLIGELGQGFIAAMSLIQNIRHDLRSSATTCHTCTQIARALGGLDYDDFERILGDLE